MRKEPWELTDEEAKAEAEALREERRAADEKAGHLFRRQCEIEGRDLRSLPPTLADYLESLPDLEDTSEDSDT